MKAKRKVHLSGKWWYPNREFEMIVNTDIVSIIEAIEKLKSTNVFLSWRSGRYVIISKSEENIDQYNVIAGRVSVKGELKENQDTVVITGQAVVGQLWTSIVSFLVFLAMIIGAMINASIVGTIIMIILLGAYTFLYYDSLDERNTLFDDFYQAIQYEKIKNEHDISATPVNTEN